jgi:hypothetical protein
MPPRIKLSLRSTEAALKQQKLMTPQKMMQQEWFIQMMQQKQLEQLMMQQEQQWGIPGWHIIWVLRMNMRMNTNMVYRILVFILIRIFG